MAGFVGGVLSALSLAIAVFFLRFSRESKDRFFAYFSAAFALLAVDWVVLALVDPPRESQHYLFLIRLLAFLLIIAGIVDKNRSPSK